MSSKPSKTIADGPYSKRATGQKVIKTTLAEENALLAACWPTEFQLLKIMMADTFDRPREPRSPEYRQGVRDLLLFKLVDKPLANPWPPASAQADAWYAGVTEGKDVHLQNMCKGNQA